MKQRIFGTAIGAKVAHCIHVYIDYKENKFLKNEQFIIFEYLQATTVFTENVYIYSFRIGWFFEKEFMIYMLFLFPISTLVTRATMESPQNIFYSASSSWYLSIYFVAFIYV